MHGIDDAARDSDITSPVASPRTDPRPMKLSVVMPVFNEVTTIEEIVRRVQNVQIEKEIVIVDDGSTDGSSDKLAKLGAQENVRVILHERNRGKGAALRSGFAEVRGDIVIVQDADLEYDPRDYIRLIEPIVDGKADVVFGSRFMGGQSRRVLYFWHAVANRMLTLVSNMLTNLNLSDMEVCYKVFRREILDQARFRENRFGFEPEFTARIARLGYRVYEVGISYSGRTYDDGKKIGWRDGCRALWCIVRYNLWH